MRCVTYKCILIFIIIQYVKSQDNNPDQPAEDEEEDEDDNFEVLDLEQIIQQRLSRFDDPQYLPDYQQLQESQYQPETFQYQSEYHIQPESLQYQPQQYGQLPSQQQLQTQTQEQKYYVPPTTQPTTQVPQVTQESQYQYYVPQSQDPYGYQQPYGTQFLYDTGQQPLTETQPQIQPAYQHYVPVTQPSIPVTQSVPQPETHVTQDQYYQLYEPTQPQSIQESQPQTQTEVTQPPQTQSETVEDDDNFYVTEHDQVQQPQPQKKQRKRKKPKTTQQIQPPSGDQSDEISLSEDDEQPVKLKKPRPVKITKHIKFYKRDNLGNLVEMNESDYNVTFNDKDKKKYLFISNLERIESDGEIIFEHSSGTPYFSLLTHSKRTNIIIITNSEGFILIKKIKGEWERTDAPIPDYVNIYTQDSGGNDVLLTKYHYTITFTSIGSFRYTFLPGVNCHKIIVNGLVAWEKADDEDFPLVFYVTPKMSVIVNFENYFKVFERRGGKYRHMCTKSSAGRSKYH